MPKCKLCKKEKILIKSHIIPEFLYRELYDKNHKLIKFNAIERYQGIKKVSMLNQGEYESCILCSECDNIRIGKFESYIGKILKNLEIPISQKLLCNKIVNNTGAEFTRVENLNYKSTKIFLLGLLWKMSISKRPTFKDVNLGIVEEKIRKQLVEEFPSNDNDISIVVMSWHNDKEMKTDVILQPKNHSKNGKIYYSIILKGFIVLYFISENSITEELKFFRLKEDNTISIIHLPKGDGMGFILNYIGINHTNKINKI